jgi:hypothetical protein
MVADYVSSLRPTCCIIVNLFKHEINLNNIYELISYLTVNSLRIHCKGQLIYAVKEIRNSLF